MSVGKGRSIIKSFLFNEHKKKMKLTRESIGFKERKFQVNRSVSSSLQDESKRMLNPNSNGPVRSSLRINSSYRLNVDERCYKRQNYQSCRVFTGERLNPSMSMRQLDSIQQSGNEGLCRRCSSTETSFQRTTSVHVFQICRCCSANGESNLKLPSKFDFNDRPSRISNSSISSFNLHRCSVSSSYLPRSNSYLSYRTSSSKVKQSTIWNQQEKAFRQLFAIVFGFTCCFLPYFIVYMVVAFCEYCVSERIVTATIWLGYVNSKINPFLYAL